MKNNQKKEQQPVETHRYESDMTKKERRELEKQKLSQMNWKGKIDYIWTYYKPVFAAVLAVIVVMVFVVQQIERSKYHTILNVTVINASYELDQEAVTAQLLSQFGSGDEYDEISFDTSFMMQDIESADYNLVMKFTAVVSAGELDVLITNQAIYDHYKEQDLFMDLSTLFTAEECEKLGISEGTDRLDLSDNQWFKAQGWVDYEPVYLTVVGNTERQEKVKEFIMAVEEDK